MIMFDKESRSYKKYYKQVIKEENITTDKSLDELEKLVSF
jgi:hypothetical protein